MINLVIVCWNALEYTKITLNSLCNSIKNNSDVCLTLINNGSSDETLKYLLAFEKNSKFKTLIINNKKNLGIGAAYNQGLNESFKINAKYTVFCNNDLHFTNNWLNKLENIMNENKNIALLTPLVPSSQNYYNKTKTIKDVLLKLKDSSSPSVELDNFLTGFVDLDQFQKYVSDINNKIYGKDLRFIYFPNAVSSCVIMARTTVFKQIGFFANPLFKEYGGEDIDICWRVLMLNYKIAITNNTYIHHYRGKSIKDANLDRVQLLKKSNKKLFLLWKNEIITYYRSKGISKSNEIPKLPENWLINEMKNDINLDEELKYGIK